MKSTEINEIVAELNVVLGLSPGFCLIFLYGGESNDVRELKKRITQLISRNETEFSEVEPTQAEQVVPTVHGHISKEIVAGRSLGSVNWIALARPGTEADATWNSCRWQLLSLLNEQRTWLQRDYGRTLFIHLPEEWWRSVPDAAPDLWHVRTKSYRLPSEHKTLILRPPTVTRDVAINVSDGDVQALLDEGLIDVAFETARRRLKERASTFAKDTTNHFVALDTASAYDQVGHISQQKGDSMKAVAAFRSAVSIRRNIQRTLYSRSDLAAEIATSLESVARILIGRLEYESAAIAAKEAVAARRLALTPYNNMQVLAFQSTRIELLRTLRTLADSYRGSRDYRDATETLIECKRIAAEVRAGKNFMYIEVLSDLLTWTCGDLGDIYLETSSYSEAKREFDEGLQVAIEVNTKVARPSTDRLEAPTTLFDAQIQRSSQARRYERYKEARNSLRAALVRAGDGYLRAGELAQALEFHERGILVCREVIEECGSDIGSLRELSIALNRASHSYLAAVDSSKELLVLRECAAIRKHLHSLDSKNYAAATDYARAYGRLASCLKKNDVVPMAIETCIEGIQALSKFVHEHSIKSILGDINTELVKLTSMLHGWVSSTEFKENCSYRKNREVDPIDIDLGEIEYKTTVKVLKRASDLANELLSVRAAIEVFDVRERNEIARLKLLTSALTDCVSAACAPVAE